MNALLDEPAWFATVVNLSVQSALLACAVYAVTTTIGRWIPPQWSALLWFVVILRLLIPISPASGLSWENLLVKETATIEAAAVRPEQVRVRVQEVATDPVSVQPSPQNVTPLVQHKNFPIAPALGLIWIGGALVSFSILLARSITLLQRLRACAVAENLICIVPKTRYPLRLRVCREIAAPALTGLFPAYLLVPESFDQLQPEQIRRILLHELAHLRLGHLGLHWLAVIARCVHWFNPFVYVAASRLRQECELAADADALESASDAERIAYGETILQLVSNSLPATPLALALAESARHVEERLRALTAPPFRSARGLGIAALVALCAIGLTGADTKPNATPAVSASTQTDQPAAPAVVETTGKARIQKRLDEFRFDSFSLPNPVEVGEVLKEISADTRRRTPERVGLNFILSNDARDKFDPEQFTVKIDPPLQDVTVRQLLNAIVAAAKPPAGGFGRLAYSIEDYAIVFRVVPGATQPTVAQPPQILFDVRIAELTAPATAEIAKNLATPFSQQTFATNEYIVVTKGEETNGANGLRLPASRLAFKNAPGTFASTSTVSWVTIRVFNKGQAEEVLKLLKDSQGVELSSMALTTVIERPARISLESEATYTVPGATNTISIPTGPTVDLLALRSTEEGTLIKSTFAQTSFLGFDSETDSKNDRTHIPRFRVRSVDLSHNVPADSTLVAIMETTEISSLRKSGRAPGVALKGPSFRSESAIAAPITQTLVLITPKLIGADGMPFKLPAPRAPAN